MNDHAARRAALVLQALPLPDREWLLGQLDPSQRQQLSDLGDELSALGVEPDTRWLADRLQEPLAARPVPMPTPTPLERLRGLSVARLHTLLDREPDALLAQLLQVEAWPWSQVLVSSLPPARRQALEWRLQLPRGPAPERLAAALCAELAARAALLPADAPEPTARGGATVSPWRSWWQRQQRLRRPAP